MSDILNDELNAVFVSQERQFKGESLAAYTEGSRLLMLQVRDEEDSSMFFIWAFLFMHIQLFKNKKDAINLAWNKSLFREKVMDWVIDKTDEDRAKATELVATIIEESQKGQVEPIKTSGDSQGNA